MRKIKEILRLRWAIKLSYALISRSCGISADSAQSYEVRAKKAGLTWPLPVELDDTALERLLYPKTPRGNNGPHRPLPDYSDIHTELKKKGATLMGLWYEYKRNGPEGYEYSQFCRHYHNYRGKLKLSMRQVHRAGEKAFVDYAGQTVPIMNPYTGEIRQAEIFVAVLGASGYTYAEAQDSQNLLNWIMGHARMFEYFHGVPEIVVCDNLKSGVKKPSYYEPDINPTYHQMAVHYGTVIIPARIRKPKDKAKVEVAVQLVERWILFVLRKRVFFSIEELNVEIRRLLEKLNNRPFRNKEGSRRSLYEALDKPTLKPLPITPYEYARCIPSRVGLDYHIDVEKHGYSVPYTLVGKEVEVRTSQGTVEVYFKGNRVASHKKEAPGGTTTVREHMAPAHRAYHDWTPEKVMEKAEKVGKETVALAKAIFDVSDHPQKAIRSCVGILRLEKEYGGERLEAACRRARAIRGYRYTSVQSILKNGLDRKKDNRSPSSPTILHENIRGPEYYLN